MSDAFTALVDASFEGVGFPTSSAGFEGGNDCAEHRAYLKPGASIEQTGRNPYKGTLVIPMMNTPQLVSRYGTLFPDLLDRLRLKFHDKPIGTLTHPSLGPLTAHIKDWAGKLEAESRGGVEFTVQWTEHDASVADVFATEAPPTIERTQDHATTADTAITAVRPGAPSLRTSVDAATATAGRSTASPQEISSVFAQLDQDIDEAAAYEEVQEATSASIAALTAIEQLRAAAVSLRSQYTQRTNARLYTVPQSGLSVVDIALELYGSLEGVAKIMGANALVSTTLSPGRILTIPT